MSFILLIFRFHGLIKVSEFYWKPIYISHLVGGKHKVNQKRTNKGKFSPTNSSQIKRLKSKIAPVVKLDLILWLIEWLATAHVKRASAIVLGVRGTLQLLILNLGLIFGKCVKSETEWTLWLQTLCLPTIFQVKSETVHHGIFLSSNESIIMCITYQIQQDKNFKKF